MDEGGRRRELAGTNRVVLLEDSEMKLSELGVIIEPNVHDSELVRMEFGSRWIDLHIKLVPRDGNFMLRLVNPRWMSFSTNHPQNVIDRIVVTPDLKEAAALAPKYIREMLWTREQTIPGQTEKATPLKAVHIMPAAGPELTCIAHDVTVIAP